VQRIWRDGAGTGRLGADRIGPAMNDAAAVYPRGRA
jgi:hypothetical protein